MFRGNDTICQRCMHKVDTPGRLGCDRTQLLQLLDGFLPEIIFSHLTHNALEHFAHDHIAGYDWRKTIPIQLTSGFGPPFSMRANEACPKDDWMLHSTQFRQNIQTQQWETVKVSSPPLAMIFRGEDDVQAWRKRLKVFLETILVHDFRDIPRRCFPGWKEPNRIFRRIMKLVHQYYRDCPPQVGCSALESTSEC